MVSGLAGHRLARGETPMRDDDDDSDVWIDLQADEALPVCESCQGCGREWCERCGGCGVVDDLPCGWCEAGALPCMDCRGTGHA